MTLNRKVGAETLDHLDASDPAAQRSRRDLTRVHRVMGTRGIVARGWQALWPAPDRSAPLRVLELGAGDGTLMLAVARRLAPSFPRVELTLLDRQDIVSPATLAAFAALGWQVTVELADVLDWAARGPSTVPGSAAASWDLVITTLFLHHFEGADLDTLLMAIAARSQRFFACEPRRGWLALTGSHLIGAIGANAVTREDAVLSVHAGFRERELTALWPAPPAAWQSREYTAGLFGHCFSTSRAETRAWGAVTAAGNGADTVRRYDAVVIGAGPAGSTAALLLARAGWRVALVEKQAFPRRKVCGECIAASNLPLLDELGLGALFAAGAGSELRQVRLLHGARAITAALPAAAHPRHAWGRALGRETLDTLLLAQARDAGAEVLQPWSLQSISGTAGAWSCEVRAVDGSGTLRLRAQLVIDAHGCWEALPSARTQRGVAHGASDLFAFKADFSDAELEPGTVHVLALDGGYGGMVQTAGHTTTVACCLRRDRMHKLRCAAPGQRAGDIVEAWLRLENLGVQRALQTATRLGPWLAAGPLVPGVRVATADGLFRVGNAAGEAHPVLGEGLSMALQSAALLCSHLLAANPAAAPPAATHAALQERYAADWRRHFTPRLRVAAALAHAAMRPRATTVLMTLLRAWPGLLTAGARWGGKVRAGPRARAWPAALPHGTEPQAAPAIPPGS